MGEEDLEPSRCRGKRWWFLVLILAVIGAAIAITIKVKMTHRHSTPKLSSVPGPPGKVVKRYGDALTLATQFFQVQQSGKLVDNTIAWRGDSALQDGSEAQVDLSKGMVDAGDHMKFGLPMAFTATVLSWAILEYGERMQTVNQLNSAQDSLKWITDYLINAHSSSNVLYVQVGDPVVDHACWDRPEGMTEVRPLTQVNTSSPGSDVAAETAAAMASASLVFKSSNSTYSSLLLHHAQELFTFADTHRGVYSESIPEVQDYYNSTGYGDDLLWAASWLYLATENQSYFDYVTGENGIAFANWGNPSWFNWDNKLAGTQVLLSRVSFFGGQGSSNSGNLKNYRETAEAVMCGLLPESPTATASRTAGGLIWVSGYNSMQFPVASALLAVIYSDYMLTSQTANFSCNGDTYFGPSDLRNFAISQADYVLGNNPKNLSYLVGYGDRYPQYVHHRGASIPANATTGCLNGWVWLTSTEPNPNVAVGALVGGPSLDETFTDSRNNSMQTEATTYNSALIVGLLSGLVTTSSVVKSFT